VSERPYRLVVLAADGAWCSEVVDAMKEALLAQVGREDLVAFEDVLSAPTDPAEAAPQTVVIFLADATSRADQALVAQLDEAHERLVPVLPAVRPGGGRRGRSPRRPAAA